LIIKLADGLAMRERREFRELTPTSHEGSGRAVRINPNLQRGKGERVSRLNPNTPHDRACHGNPSPAVSSE